MKRKVNQYDRLQKLYCTQAEQLLQKADVLVNRLDNDMNPPAVVFAIKQDLEDIVSRLDVIRDKLNQLRSFHPIDLKVLLHYVAETTITEHMCKPWLLN